MVKQIIGILGGMGPAAGVDMLSKFISSFEADCDQAHIPIILSSIPDVPDRSAFLLNNGPDPYPRLLHYAQNLEKAGATCMVIACNTAHYWFDRLHQDLPHLHMISMIDATVSHIAQHKHHAVGILATNATLTTSLYKNKITTHKLNYIEPDTDSQNKVMQSIYLYKAGKIVESIVLMQEQKDKLISKGADVIIMGCTEVPLILQYDALQHPSIYIDATQILVNNAISWYRQSSSHL